MTQPRASRFIVYVVALAATVVTILAVRGALRWYAHPIGGLLVDPDLVISSISLPNWEGPRHGLKFPDRIVGVEGRPLEVAPGEVRARAFDRAIERAHAEGRPTVRATVETRAGTREVELRLRPLEPLAWWMQGGVLIFIGALYVVAALTALVASPDGKLARTFAKTALLAALMLLTIFDFHTTRTLVPLMLVAFAMTPFAFVQLGLRLPDDVALLKKHPWLVTTLDFVGLAMATAMVVRHLVGETTTDLRQFCTMAFGASQAIFVITVIVRYVRQKGEGKQTMRTLLVALIVAHVPGATLFVLAMLTSAGTAVASFVLPVLAFSPLATVVAFIRNDLWGSRALLSRVLTRGVVGAIATAVAVAAATVFAESVGIPFYGALVAATTGGIIAVLIVGVALYASDRGFFPSVAEYKPTVDTLSEELTSIRDPHEVTAAVERTVRRWLDCDRVEFSPFDPHHEKTPVPNDRRELQIPVAFHGQVVGILCVGRKRGGALYTSEDVDLLRTIANQAALALAYAQSYAELEERRRTQAAAWKEERATLVETVAAEIAHEVRYPINFFRSVFKRTRDRTLDIEEIEIGCEEVDRLERLVSGLRRLLGHRLERRPVPLSDLAARAEMLLRDAVGERDVELDVPEGLALFCDPDQATQIVVNLMSNALEATSAHDAIGLRFVKKTEGAELVVWDTGPGFTGDPAELFTPWFTTKARGTGLGLAITQRLVRAHGWTIDALREDGVTRFVISLPASDVVEPPVLNGRQKNSPPPPRAPRGEAEERT
jgi:signal transduction histidine kinase